MPSAATVSAIKKIRFRSKGRTVEVRGLNCDPPPIDSGSLDPSNRNMQSDANRLAHPSEYKMLTVTSTFVAAAFTGKKKKGSKLHTVNIFLEANICHIYCT